MNLPELPGAIGPALAFARDAATLAYLGVQAAVVLYASHRGVVLWRWWRASRVPLAAPVPPADWPVVTVQLPLFNERRVAARLIDAVAALDYPRDRLEVQVLDDSTDDTSDRVAVAVARHRATGLAIEHVRRGTRDGYKAGALANGLARATGSLIAVFDADFVPRPDFLRRMVPHFADPGVGLAQARWGHLNRDRSWFTAAQAAMLDSHFLLEHRARMGHGLFFNFNGTAGVWRRACIEEAGGWAHDTLTEDLDLSYRAQLAGWRFVFDASVESPAELPAGMAAFRSQQRRWAKGSIQTARKVLPRLFASRLPWDVKVEAFVHLTGNVAYPLVLALGLLLPSALLAPRTLPPAAALALQLAVVAFGLLPVAVFLVAGQRAAGARWGGALRASLGALVLGIGMSVNNARAVLGGLARGTGDWERTPKSGDGCARVAGAAYRAAPDGGGKAELALALYATGTGVLALALGEWRAVPFVVLLGAGSVLVGWASARESRRAAPAGAVGR